MDFSEFKIIWIEKRDYSCEGHVYNHNHIFYHYIYVIGGEAELKADKEELKMLPGNIYLISPYVYHSFSWEGNEPFNTIEIKFSIEDADCEKALNRLPLNMCVKNLGVYELLTSLYNEFKSKQPLFDEIVRCKFQLVMATLQRCFMLSEKDRDSESDNHKFPHEIKAVLDYIGENLKNEISLEMLAEVSGYEKNYFSRKFKRTTGHTPMLFLTEARIKKAKELLVYSDFNISQIAEMTGFQNIHYFSNVFLKYVGSRPLEYREKMPFGKFEI